MPTPSRALFLAILGVCCAMCASAQRAANSNAIYQQLRGLQPGGEVVTVSNLELHRDAAVFTFRSGSFAFFGNVNGKVTGAVFKGDGHMHITPPSAEERRNLRILNHTEEFDEDFDEAVLRFTDDTSAQLHKASTGAGQDNGTFGKAADELKYFMRHHDIQTQTGNDATYYYKVFYTNLDLRLLEDVLSPAQGGYFFASLHGGKHERLFFILDPNGVEEVEPEEVALLAYDSTNNATTYPLAFHRAAEYAQGTPSGDEENAAYKMVHEDLDVSIEKNGFLSSTATVEVRAQQAGVAVVPLNLYPSLRVSKVETMDGAALDFVEENKDLDPDLGVVLAAPLKKGETAKFRITYAGKDVVLNMGNGNYYPIARENWYPSSSQGLGDYATYGMTFHVPKGTQMVATGTKTAGSDDGKITTTEWKTETPLPVVGFSLGEFKSKEATIGEPLKGQLTIDAYANTLPPNNFDIPGGNGMLGTLQTLSKLPDELAQGQAAAQIYTQYFGQLPFPHVSLTQQSACNYGQSWPMLVYLPICGFFDDTQRHWLGLGGENSEKHSYWRVVTPHEVAHQWWGQTVGFRGYRDQWMSEGFADASAAIYLLLSQPKPDQYLSFWKDQLHILTSKNSYGFRPIDVGPVTMGMRLSTGRTGWGVYGDLVYPKGAYILHMIQMMMWSSRDGDTQFKAMMQDFVSTYTLRPATTEDFKAIMEKHMSPAMDLDGNQRMDWFFNQYVYGTELPEYHFESQVTPSGEGASLHFKLTQSGVSPEFKMMVPIYLEMADGRISKLGAVKMVGASTTERTLQLQKLPAPAKRVLIDYYYDILAIEN